MTRRLRPLVVALALLATVGLVPTPAAAASCEDLTALILPDTTITLAESLPASATLPARCRAVGIVTPTANSVIGFEVWMPVGAAWNGKFQGVGSGGSAGAISTSGLTRAVQRGYAAMATDNGHIGSSWTFAHPPLGHPEKVIDFGYRAQHVTTVAAKAVIQAFYGGGPRHSYFVGCSQGGHHGLMQAQRFPGDYDGIVAGAPANNWTNLMVAEVWTGVVSSVRGPAYDLPPDKIALLNQAVTARCDALDGVADGILDDPRRCDFAPRTLQCEGPDAATCLTAEQVEAVELIVAGPRNPRTGEQIYPGLPWGSEGGWRQFLVGGSLPGGSARSFFRDGVFADPAYDFLTFDFDQDVTFTNTMPLPGGDTWATALNAVDPDLSGLKARGGRLIIYHGWADTFLGAQHTVDYFESVVATMGHPRKETDEFVRLFMLPGVYHCSGGPGPDSFDALTALEQWVEQGIAPDRLIASKVTAGVVTRTRPLCPYPQVARWTGEGSTDDAANFVCGLKGLDRADQASGFDHGLQGRNNARRKQAR